MVLGVVTGMAAEAACFATSSPNVIVRAAGADRVRTREIARDLTREGIVALVSFGVAGGLDPRLRSGDLVIADAVLGREGGRYVCDRGWRSDLVGTIRGEAPFQIASITGSDRAVTTPDEKSAVRDKTGASAVDMESDIVGSVAAELEKPLIVIRAIADAADAAVPAWALAAVGPDGRSRPSVVVGQLLRRPNEIGALVRLAGDFRRALKSLRVAAAAIEAVHTRRIAADDEEA